MVLERPFRGVHFYGNVIWMRMQLLIGQVCQISRVGSLIGEGACRGAWVGGGTARRGAGWGRTVRATAAVGAGAAAEGPGGKGAPAPKGPLPPLPPWGPAGSGSGGGGTGWG